MKTGLIGYGMSGKSTLFCACSGSEIENRQNSRKAALASIKVPDQRVNHLSEIFKPKKTVFAEIVMEDPPSSNSEGKKLVNELVGTFRQKDAVILVVRAFDQGMGPARPEIDFQKLYEELILIDLALAETRIEKLSAQLKKTGGLSDEKNQLEIIQKASKILEDMSRLISAADKFSPEELKLLYQQGFITLKPLVLAINVDDSNTTETAQVLMAAAAVNVPAFVVSAEMELELSRLETEEEKQQFRQELNLGKSGKDEMIRTLFEACDLLSFFTVGSDEVRSWTTEAGSTARQAAGCIHSDLERGFIRADVVNYQDFIKYGSLTKSREAAVLRLEGRDYKVADGDIIEVRFNV